MHNRFETGDRIGFDAGEDIVYGTIEDITKLTTGEDVLYKVVWDDGFDDGEGNIFPERELLSLEEAEEKVS